MERICPSVNTQSTFCLSYSPAHQRWEQEMPYTWQTGVRQIISLPCFQPLIAEVKQCATINKGDGKEEQGIFLPLQKVYWKCLVSLSFYHEGDVYLTLTKQFYWPNLTHSSTLEVAGQKTFLESSSDLFWKILTNYSWLLLLLGHEELFEKLYFAKANPLLCWQEWESWHNCRGRRLTEEKLIS